MVTRLTWLDSLKGIAILFVMAIHCGVDGLPRKLALFVESGGAWVQMFLLISVVLTLGSYDRMKHGPVVRSRVRCWIVDRFVRIVPLYYLALVLSLVCYGGVRQWLGSEGQVTASNVLCHLFFLHGLFPHYANSIIGVEWYVGVLALFYLLVPLLYRFVTNISRAALSFSLALVACHFLTRIAYYAVLPHVIDRDVVVGFLSGFCILASVPNIFLGCILYFVLKKPVKLFLPLMILAFCLYHGMLRGENALFYFKPQTIDAIIFSLVILAVANANERIINNAWLAFLGRHSLGLYLFHILLLRALKVSWPWGVRYVICIIGTLIFTLLCERFVDVPAQKLIAWGRKRIKASMEEKNE